jgi:hypothetical protein
MNYKKLLILNSKLLTVNSTPNVRRPIPNLPFLVPNSQESKWLGVEEVLSSSLVPKPIPLSHVSNSLGSKQPLDKELTHTPQTVVLVASL